MPTVPFISEAVTWLQGRIALGCRQDSPKHCRELYEIGRMASEGLSTVGER